MQQIEPQLFIENRTFDEIAIGETASLTRTLSRSDIETFAVLSGDVNPTHVDDEYARSAMFHEIVAHGMYGGALISTLLGTKLPGPGTTYVSQMLRFENPAGVGDTLTFSVTATAKESQRHHVTFDCLCVNQGGVTVMSGTAEVVAPTEKVKRPRVAMPHLHLHAHGILYADLIARARGLEPIPTAVVHPVDRDSLLGAVEAARGGLIVPVLIGPAEKIRAAALTDGIDISGYTVIDTVHSHAAAAKAVAMARAGDVAALMKGSLHTDELMHAVVARDTGLTTERRMSHVFVADVPTYPRPLFITDAALNIEPELPAKRDIVQNAIELAQALGVERPRVAILSAVETVNPNIRSTLDAAALTKMADRGQIVGGIVDGPLAFDNAISAEAAHTKGITSPVAGVVDIVVVPDLESGNMLYKQLMYLADSEAVGIVLGARVPIVLTSRADPLRSRVVSCALALQLARKGVRQKVSES